jgi:hypothetical protein
MNVIFCVICIRPIVNPWDSDYEDDVFRKHSSSFHTVLMSSKPTQGYCVASVSVAIVKRKGDGGNAVVFVGYANFAKAPLNLRVHHRVTLARQLKSIQLHWSFYQIPSSDVDKKPKWSLFVSKNLVILCLLRIHPLKNVFKPSCTGDENTCVPAHSLGTDLHSVSLVPSPSLLILLQIVCLWPIRAQACMYYYYYHWLLLLSPGAYYAHITLSLTYFSL